MNRGYPFKIVWLLLLVFVLPVGCGMKKETVFVGATMGTTYHIKIVTGYFKRTAGLQSRIDQRLQAVNQSMSTYIPDSEINRFNALQSTRETLNISQDFFQVLGEGAKLYALTNGAWDGTVKPLVDLWGFGTSERKPSVPDAERIARVMKDVGFGFIEISGTREIRKKRTPLSLDLASIAKGYGVDQVAAVLRSQGVHDFLVEIGGEVVASGSRKDGRPWRVGVNQPTKDSGLDAVYDVVAFRNRAMATSGDYRNYFEVDGHRYSHVLDPRTGFPVNNGVVSVSIIAPTCTFADGLATAVMVMGPDEGLAIIETLADVEGFIMVRNADGLLQTYATKGFEELLREADQPAS